MKSKHTQYIKQGLFYLVFLLLVSYVLVDVFAPRQTVNLFGFKTYVVVSPSMEPDIMVLDAVVVIKTPAHKLEPGQAITFIAFLPALGDYDVVTHYLVSIEEVDGKTIYTTQGAGKAPDDLDQWTDADGQPIDLVYDDIIGRVWFSIPQAGKILLPLSNPVMVLLIMVNIVVLVTLFKMIKTSRRST